MAYLISPAINSNPYHVSVARRHLARNISCHYPDVADEIFTAFDEVLDIKSNGISSWWVFPLCANALIEWTSISTATAMREIVCRISNRVFVGLPLCTSLALLDDNFLSFVSCSGRNADWIDLNSRFAIDVMKDATFLNMFPKALVPWVSHDFQFCLGLLTNVVISLVARFVSSTARCIRQGMEHLDPIIKERLKCMDEYGTEWTNKPVSH